MKITAVKTFTVPPRWLFVKIETDEGISGWGEAVLEGRFVASTALIGALCYIGPVGKIERIQDLA